MSRRVFKSHEKYKGKQITPRTSKGSAPYPLCSFPGRNVPSPEDVRSAFHRLHFSPGQIQLVRNYWETMLRIFRGMERSRLRILQSLGQKGKVVVAIKNIPVEMKQQVVRFLQEVGVRGMWPSAYLSPHFEIEATRHRKGLVLTPRKRTVTLFEGTRNKASHSEIEAQIRRAIVSAIAILSVCDEELRIKAG